MTPEWAYEVTGRLIDLETKLDRLLTFLGIDAGQRPDEIQHTDRGLFAPGSGWISDQPRTEGEPSAPDEVAAASLAAARAQLGPRRGAGS